MRAMQRPEVLAEDNHLLVVSKPSGLLTLPDRYEPDAPNLVAYLQVERPKIYVVHRLDRDTSGLVVFALSPEAHQSLSVQFAGHEVVKRYLVLIHGSPAWEARTIDMPLRVDADRRHRTRVDQAAGKRAVTRISVLEQFDAYALVEALPETGRTHQIRAHLAAVNHPIVCDPLYGDGRPLFLSSFKRRYNPGRREERPLIARTALHASELRFVDPVSGKDRAYSAPGVRDMHAAVNQLRKFGTTPLISSPQELRGR